MPTVLIVDDDEPCRRLIQIALAPLGYETILAEDGEEGVMKAVQFIPDLIVLDLLMPKKDGYAVAEQIRSIARTKNIPILILTALRTQWDRYRAVRHGIQDYLTKPFKPEELRARVKELVEGCWGSKAEGSCS